MIVVFGLEIQQKITGRGKMEFQDVVYGLWGFLAIFFLYISVRIIIYLITRFMRKSKPQKHDNCV